MLFKRIMVLVCVATPVAVYAQSEMHHTSTGTSIEFNRDTMKPDTTKPDTTKPDTTKPDTSKKTPPAQPNA